MPPTQALHLTIPSSIIISIVCGVVCLLLWSFPVGFHPDRASKGTLLRHETLSGPAHISRRIPAADTVLLNASAVSFASGSAPARLRHPSSVRARTPHSALERTSRNESHGRWQLGLPEHVPVHGRLVHAPWPTRHTLDWSVVAASVDFAEDGSAVLLLGFMFVWDGKPKIIYGHPGQSQLVTEGLGFGVFCVVAGVRCNTTLPAWNSDSGMKRDIRKSAVFLVTCALPADLVTAVAALPSVPVQMRSEGLHRGGNVVLADFALSHVPVPHNSTRVVGCASLYGGRQMRRHYDAPLYSWAMHHFRMGIFDHLVIVDADGSFREEALAIAAAGYPIDYYPPEKWLASNFSGYGAGLLERGGKMMQQLAVTQYCLWEWRDRAEWTISIDLDEWVVCRHNRSLAPLLQQQAQALSRDLSLHQIAVWSVEVPVCNSTDNASVCILPQSPADAFVGPKVARAPNPTLVNKKMFVSPSHALGTSQHYSFGSPPSAQATAASAAKKKERLALRSVKAPSEDVVFLHYRSMMAPRGPKEHSQVLHDNFHEWLQNAC
jgi:hypothetical protein